MFFQVPVRSELPYLSLLLYHLHGFSGIPNYSRITLNMLRRNSVISWMKLKESIQVVSLICTMLGLFAIVFCLSHHFFILWYIFLQQISKKIIKASLRLLFQPSWRLISIQILWNILTMI